MTTDEKGKRTVNVTDRPVELQSMAQTILTFLVLCVMSWIGITLEDVRDNTYENNKNIALFNKDLKYQGKLLEDHIKLLDEHIKDKRVHI